MGYGRGRVKERFGLHRDTPAASSLFPIALGLGKTAPQTLTASARNRTAANIDLIVEWALVGRIGIMPLI